jgi:hypothetical protein
MNECFFLKSLTDRDVFTVLQEFVETVTEYAAEFGGKLSHPYLIPPPREPHISHLLNELAAQMRTAFKNYVHATLVPRLRAWLRLTIGTHPWSRSGFFLLWEGVVVKSNHIKKLSSI